MSIKDVARNLGVSVSTVSRVLNDHPDVSEAMHQRVSEAMERLGYEPDFLAQSLRAGFTKTVGFVLRDLSNPIFADIVKGCETMLRGRGYALILANSEGDAEFDERNIRVLRQRRVDGLILSLQSEDTARLVPVIEELEIPIVLIDREIPGVDAAAVRCDHRTGVGEAIRHLIELGHRRIAMISGPADVLATRDRLAGYTEQMKAARLRIDKKLIRLGSYSQSFGYSEAKALLTGNSRPTAIFAAGVQLTEGVLRACQELGLETGKDVALVAGDDNAFMSFLDPPVSVVQRDTRLIGETAAELLLDMIVEQKPPREGLIPTTYIARGTSQPPG